jgi:hypothetical protein
MDLLPISDLPNYLNILVYGRPDAGKTTFGCSGSNHEEFSSTVIMNIEDGLQSVRWSGKDLMRTQKIETSEQIEAVILAAASKTGGFANCRCLVVDSLTKMADIMLRRIAADGHRRQARKGGAGEIQRNDYGKLYNLMMRYIDLLIGLDMHIVFIALEKEVKDEETEMVTDITVGLPGQLADKVIAACDMVFALKKMPAIPATQDKEAQDASVAMLTQQQGMQHARVRNKELREEIDLVITNPTLPGLWDIYNRALATGRASIEG